MPVEGVGSSLIRVSSKSLGIVPKVAIVALVKWLERNGYNELNWDFIDIDMMFSDEFILEYFSKTNQTWSHCRRLYQLHTTSKEYHH